MNTSEITNQSDLGIFSDDPARHLVACCPHLIHLATHIPSAELYFLIYIHTGIYLQQQIMSNNLFVLQFH